MNGNNDEVWKCLKFIYTKVLIEKCNPNKFWFERRHPPYYSYTGDILFNSVDGRCYNLFYYIDRGMECYPLIIFLKEEVN